MRAAAQIKFQARMETTIAILKMQTQLSLNESSFETLMNLSNEELMELEKAQSLE